MEKKSGNTIDCTWPSVVLRLNRDKREREKEKDLPLSLSRIQFEGTVTKQQQAKDKDVYLSYAATSLRPWLKLISRVALLVSFTVVRY